MYRNMTIAEKRLSKLINDLSNPDPSKRRSSAEALSSSDERAIYHLIKALRDESPGVQDAAMRSLISLGGEVTAHMVLPLLRDEPYLRNTAMIILKEIGRDAIPLLKPFLRDKDSDIRKFAVDLISEIGYCTYPEELVRNLQDDPNINVRASAAKAIGNLQYKEALPQMIDALKDDEWVCFSALESLAIMKEESSLEPIISLLDHPSDAVRYAAVDTLGRIGFPRSSDALIKHLQKTEGFEKTAAIKSLVQIGVTPLMSEVSSMFIDMFGNGDWDEKIIALKGLCDLKEERAIYRIIDVAGSLDPSEPQAEERLSYIKNMLLQFGCSDALVDTLNSPAIRYRGKKIAIELLGDLKCEKAISHLIGLIDSNLRDIKRAATKALGDINNEDTRQALVDAIDDEDGHVRREAVAALGKIGDKTSFQPILKLLYEEHYKDVIEEAVKALLTIDSAALCSHMNTYPEYAKEAISKYSEDIDILLSLSHDKSLKVKVTALSKLGMIQDKRATERLTEAIQDGEPEVRRAAMMAMSELHCCHEEVKSALHDKDTWVRLYAVKSLGHSSQKDMIKILIPMLSDKEIPVVLSTIDALVRLGGKESSSILLPLLNHGEKVIREKIQQVIDSSDHSDTVER